MSLREYQQKRNFQQTPEPAGRRGRVAGCRFVVQEHHASHLHYDFRLEIAGVLKSWAIPKGPSLNPRQRRLAVQVEDHPVEYIDFHGTIGVGNYGAGKVAIWDKGTYAVSSDQAPLEQLQKGNLSFTLYGNKLRGAFHLVRMQAQENQWLLIKGKDQYAETSQASVPIQKGHLNGRRRSKSAQVDKKSQAHSPIKPTKPKKTHSSATKEQASVVSLRTLSSAHLRGDVTVKVKQWLVSLTHLDRLYWPDDGYTKADLAQYYVAVADGLLPFLRDRPLILKRYPQGIHTPFFFQHAMEDAPEFVETFATTTEAGRQLDYVVCNNLATLLYLAQLGTLELHPWHSRMRTIERPDWIIFDLDPEKAEFATVCELALALKGLLREMGLESYPKTSSASGMHVYVPIKPLYTYDQVAQVAEQIAMLLERECPQISTLERTVKKRPSGRVYIDHLQNAHGKAAVAPYAVRAQPGAPVSTPLSWREVKQIPDPRKFTLKTVPQRLAKKGDCFREVLTNKQALSRVLNTLKRQLG